MCRWGPVAGRTDQAAAVRTRAPDPAGRVAAHQAPVDRLLAAQRRVAAESTVVRPAGGVSQQTEDVLHSILKTARDHFDLEVAFISRFREGRRAFVSVESSMIDVQVGMDDLLDQTHCGHVVRGLLPSFIADAREHPEARLLADTEAFDIRTYLSVPIRRPDGSVYGTFCCFGTTPSPSLGESAVKVMTAFAQVAGEALERDEAVADRLIAGAAGIRDLISDDRIRIRFQPIVELASGTPVGYEALARFETDPVEPPDRWFAKAAVAGVGVVLEARTIELALPAIEDMPPDCYLSVNASAATIESNVLRGLLDSMTAERIVIELTEHDRVDSLPRILERLADLRNLGVRLSIDDTGSGYAGLHRLVSLSPDIIKLDRSFVAGIDRNPALQAMGDALGSFSTAIGARFIAEGIETQGELEHLVHHGVTYGQGYLVGRPGPLPALG